jgi:hypothetical protein
MMTTATSEGFPQITAMLQEMGFQFGTLPLGSSLQGAGRLRMGQKKRQSIEHGSAANKVLSLAAKTGV